VGDTYWQKHLKKNPRLTKAQIRQRRKNKNEKKKKEKQSIL